MIHMVIPWSAVVVAAVFLIAAIAVLIARHLLCEGERFLEHWLMPMLLITLVYLFVLTISVNIVGISPLF